MRDDDCGVHCSAHGSGDPAHEAARLVALAREARLLEFALDGDGDMARRLATALESALEQAMEAESADDVMQACVGAQDVLAQIVDSGMRLSAELSDMQVGGVLGARRMAVLTAVLTAVEPE